MVVEDLYVLREWRWWRIPVCYGRWRCQSCVLDVVGDLVHYKLAPVYAVSGDVKEVVGCVIDLSDLPSVVVIRVGWWLSAGSIGARRSRLGCSLAIFLLLWRLSVVVCHLGHGPFLEVGKLTDTPNRFDVPYISNRYNFSLSYSSKQSSTNIVLCFGQNESMSAETYRFQPRLIWTDWNFLFWLVSAIFSGFG